MTKVTLPDKPPRRWWWWWQWWLWALALVISSTHTKRPSSATFELVFVSLFLPNLLSNAFPSPQTLPSISFTLSTTLNWTCNWVNRAGNAFAFSTRGYHHRYVYPSRGRLSSSLMMSRLAPPRRVSSIIFARFVMSVQRPELSSVTQYWRHYLYGLFTH